MLTVNNTSTTKNNKHHTPNTRVAAGVARSEAVSLPTVPYSLRLHARLGRSPAPGRARTAHAAALIKGGALLERLSFALREEGGAVIGFAEVMLVRVPPPATHHLKAPTPPLPPSPRPPQRPRLPRRPPPHAPSP